MARRPFGFGSLNPEAQVGRVNRVGIIGFGEAGQAFAGDAGRRGAVTAYDRLTDSDATRQAKLQDFRATDVHGALTMADALHDSATVLSLVTADQSLSVAQAAARLLGVGALYCDMNSVAPGTKRAAETAVRSGGGRYVDVAIMAPVNPGRLAVPLLLSGEHAFAAAEQLRAFGFTRVRVIGDRVGDASAIKMIRSVIVKGIEALTAEAMLAADEAGVTGEVLASLDASDKQIRWETRADYNLDRMLVHGGRRAEEMREVVRTLEDLGIEPRMSRSTVDWQDRLGTLGILPVPQGLGGKIGAIKGRETRTP